MPQEDLEPPQIMILSPGVDEELSGSDSILVHVVFTENTELHNTEIWIWNPENHDPITRVAHHSHQQRLEVKHKFWFPVSEPTKLEIEVTASDHNGNDAVQIYNFNVLP